MTVRVAAVAFVLNVFHLNANRTTIREIKFVDVNDACVCVGESLKL